MVVYSSSSDPKKHQKNLMSVAKILNINWIERGIDNDARLICSWGAVCPRKPSCYQQCEAR
ncbi:DUF3612 domain-containing protein [Marinomonas sp. BSi20584]|uniref:DUF3612 domain-containing protein n=1 Tax=Marinomonas sp. BSi20584 TaxID=1594462 RepID=UPI0022B7C905|nr:DUF3612 domain-containing protein [Marinomonas sp. BSi20584]